jgi:hypothetical protein
VVVRGFKQNLVNRGRPTRIRERPITISSPRSRVCLQGQHGCVPGVAENRCFQSAAVSKLIIIAFCSTSYMTAVDHPNISAPFIAVKGPSSRQPSTGVTSP